MTKLLAAVVALAFFFGPTATLADGPSYDDPSIHYSAPDGWTKIDVPQTDNSPAAVFSKQFSRYDTRVIMLVFDRTAGSLDGFETSHESDRRSQGSDVFVDNKKKITMPNGMPAWQVRYSYGSDSGSTIRALEYVVYDGHRGIVLSYSGRAGGFDDKEALEALGSLTVVLYPTGR